MNHSLTNINAEAMTGECAVCGPIDIKKQYKKNAKTQSYVCKQKVRDLANNRSNKDLVRRSRLRAKVKKDFGITLEEYEEFREKCFIEQNKSCAICHEKIDKQKAHLDHCHTTLKMRGLLCRACNIGLGMFRDNPDYLNSAANYLKD